MKLTINRRVRCNLIEEGRECKSESCGHRFSHSCAEGEICKTSCNWNGEILPVECKEVRASRSLTFSERYKEHNKEGLIFGTVWMGFYTFTEFYRQALGILACEGFGFPKGLIYDGYWLVFLSPLVLVYWILLLPMILVFSVVWLLFWPLFIPLGIWSLFIELPASILNKKEIEHWKC